MKLLLVGDGERDGATVPPLIEKVLGQEPEVELKPWSRLHGAKGYAKKVLFAALQARDENADGLVAVVDRDREPKRKRLQQMVEGRDKANAKLAMPIALGEADPHGEAWLVDDAQAVREALDLPSDTQIPPVTKIPDPKGFLQEFINEGAHSEAPILEVLEAVARKVDLERCRHTKETGFQQLADDLKHLAKQIS